MDVKNDDGDDDRKGDENHGKKEVFSDERNDDACRRNDLGQQQEKHSQ